MKRKFFKILDFVSYLCYAFNMENNVLETIELVNSQKTYAAQLESLLWGTAEVREVKDGKYIYLQIRDLLKKSESLRACAKANTEQDFAFPYYESADDVLIEGLSQNQDFFTLLLNNDDIKKEMLGIFLGEIYKEFRND